MQDSHKRQQQTNNTIQRKMMTPTTKSSFDEAESRSSPELENPPPGEENNPQAGSPVAGGKSRREKYPPSFFTDDIGNLKFVNLVVRHPCKIFFAILALNILFTALLIPLVFSGNPFSNPGSQYDVNDVRSIAYDSLKLAEEEVTADRALLEMEIAAPPARAQEQQLDSTIWVYEAEEDTGVFGSAESVRGMKESLDLFMDDPNYETFCWKRYSTIVQDDNTSVTTSGCRLPLSPLLMYYAADWNVATVTSIITELKVPGNIARYNDLALCVEFNLLCENVSANVYTDADFAWARALNEDITSVTDLWDGTGDLVEENIDQVTMFAAYLMQLDTKRGFVDFGFDKNFNLTNPVSQYSRAILTWGAPLSDSLRGVSNATEEEQDQADSDALREYFVENFLDNMNEISSVDHSPAVNSYYFMGALILDVLLSIVTWDALLALASFAFVFLYIRLAVGSWFLAIVGMTEILLSVPVSWFIYNSVFQIKYFAFLNTLSLYIVAAIGADDIFIFMDAYKQSAHSDDPEVLESLESRMSWVYRRTGSAMAITSATTCSAFLCTLITPLVDVQAFGVFAATVILVDYILVMTLFCTAVVIYHNKFERPGCFASCGAACRTTDPSPTAKALTSIGSEDKVEDRIGDFFRNRVSPFIGNQTNRIVIGLIAVVWVSVAGYSVSRLEPTQEAEQFLGNDHPLQKSITILNTAFPTAQDDSGLSIYFSWGLEDVDRDGVNLLLNPTFYGAPKFSGAFEFNEQCQTSLLEACVDMRTNASYQPHIKQEAGRGSVSCFIEEFAAYSALGTLSNCQDVTAGSWRTDDWQVAPEDVPALMGSFLEERSCFSDEGQSISNQYKNQIGWDGMRVAYAGFSLESSVIDPFSTLPESTVRFEYDKMITIAQELDTSIKGACGSEVVMTDLETKFIFMNNQRIYSRSALQSSLLGVGIGFTVLLLATRVFHIAVLATLTIACVLVSVAGTMVLIGWKLGSIEAILISIVAGFSVDYVVHLSHAYVQASGSTEKRITAAFGEMGISVLNGMVTSVGASIPLFLCQLTFFRKFGTFLCLTIAFSWLFANFVFMGMLAQFKLPVKKEDSANSTKTQEVHAGPVENLVAPKAIPPGLSQSGSDETAYV